MKFLTLITLKLKLRREEVQFSAAITGFLAFALSIACPVFAADDVSQSFTYQGRFYNSTGTAPLSDIVDLILAVYNPAGTCLLYEEVQANIDLTATHGLFAVQVGSGVGALQRSGSDPGLTVAKVFTNLGTQIRAAGGTCPGGYTPSAGDGRVLRVTVTPHSTLVPSTLVPDRIIGSQTTSIVAQTLQGLASGDFIQSAAGVAGQAGVSLASLTTLTGGSSTDASTLHNHDSLYVKLSGGGTSSNLGSGIAYTTGNLGIGTAVPTADIGFGGTLPRTIQVERNSVANNAGNNLILLAGGATSGGTDKSGGNLILSSGTSTGAGSSGIQFNTASSGIAGTTDRAPSTKMTLTADGRLGVGISTPGAQVEIDASGSAIKGQIIKGAASQSSNLLEFQNSTGSILSYFDATGYLTLPGDPTSALQPATKQYVNGLLTSGAVSSFNTRTGAVILTSNDVSTALGYTPVNQAGDTLTGALILAANPTTALGAATQQYVTGLLALKQDTGDYVTALTGDVTAAGSGSVVATVSTVGGSSAVNIHTAELAANAATNINAASKIVARDPSGNFVAGTVTAALIGNVAGNVTGNVTGSVTGNVSGNVTGNLTGAVSGAAADNVLKAGDSMTGLLYLSSPPLDPLGAVTKQYVDDINTSLNSTITGTTSSLTLTFTSPLVNTSGNVAMLTASGSSNGLLSSSDWTTFNSKQGSLGYSPVNRTGDTVSGLLILSSTGTSLTTLGNVGIGVTNPTAVLEMNSGSSIVGTGGAPQIAFQYNTSGGYRHFIRTRHQSLVNDPGNAIDFFLNNSGSGTASISPGTGNVLGMTVTAAGVGIGTATPASALEVNGTVTATAFSGSVTGASSLNVLKSGDVMSGALSITNATSSGSPTTGALIVTGGLGLSGQLVSSNTIYANYGGVGSYGQLQLFPASNNGEASVSYQQNAAGSSAASWRAGINVNSAGNNTFGIYSSTLNADALVIDSSGNVGIGTTTPTAPLDVKGGGHVIANLLTSDTYGNMFIAAESGTDQFIFQAAGGGCSHSNCTGYGIMGTNSTGTELRVVSANRQMMIITPDGNLGIGPNFNDPLATLHVSGSNGVILNAGNVGIGTTNPNQLLQVNGFASATQFLISSNNTAYSSDRITIASSVSPYYIINSDHGIGVNLGRDATSWSAQSDFRLKREILPLEDALNKTLLLNGVTYNYNADPAGARRRVGLIAQDVQAALPEAVETDEKGYLSVRYTEVIPLAINAIKALYSKMIGHDNRIQYLETENAAKNQEIQNLKNKAAKADQENITLKEGNAAIKSRLDRLERLLESK